MDKTNTQSQAQNDIYQRRPPQGTSDIARGLDLIKLNTNRELLSERSYNTRIIPVVIFVIMVFDKAMRENVPERLKFLKTCVS